MDMEKLWERLKLPQKKRKNWFQQLAFWSPIFFEICWNGFIAPVCTITTLFSFYIIAFFFPVCVVCPLFFFYYFQAKREGKRKSLSVTASDFWKAPKKRENRTVGKVFLLSVQPVNTFQFAAETIQFRNPEAFSYYSLSLFFLWRADIYVQYITIELSLDGFVGPSKYDRST